MTVRVVNKARFPIGTAGRSRRGCRAEDQSLPPLMEKVDVFLNHSFLRCKQQAVDAGSEVYPFCIERKKSE